jgi:hypothetical protein
MIAFTATLCLIITVVAALAGVAASNGSTRSLGDDFVLAGHHLSSLAAGRLFLDGIVVRIAGLPGFSMLPRASTRRLASPGSPGTDRGTAAPRAFPAARLQARQSRTGGAKHRGSCAARILD